MTFTDCLELGLDFMNSSEGIIFCIQDYCEAKKAGIPVDGVRIIDSIFGETVGYVTEETLDKYWRR